MSELRERFKHDRANFERVAATSLGESSDAEYIGWLEHRVTELEQLCESQAHALYLDPTKLPEG